MGIIESDIVTVDDFETSKLIVGSRAFASYPMSDHYRRISRQTGIDFDATIAFLARFPTFQDGAEHKASRKAMAQKMAATSDAQEAGIRKGVENFVATKLEKDATLCLVRDFSQPIWRGISSAVLEQDGAPQAAVDLVDDIPLLFAPATPLKTRIAINRRLEAVLNEAGQAIVASLTLTSLGARPFVGSMALSLFRLLDQNAGRALSQISWPDSFTDSTVPFVDRLSNGAHDIEGVEVGSANRFRCILNSSQYTPEQNHAALFGFGAHLCIGRPISKLAWSITAECLGATSHRLQPREVIIDAMAAPFYHPSHALVKVVS